MSMAPISLSVFSILGICYHVVSEKGRVCLYVCFVKVKVSKLYLVSDKTCLNLDMNLCWVFALPPMSTLWWEPSSHRKGCLQPHESGASQNMNNMTSHWNHSLFLLKDLWDCQMPVPPPITDWLCKPVRKLLTNIHQALWLMLMLILHFIPELIRHFCLLCCRKLGELRAPLDNHLYARMKHLKLCYYQCRVVSMSIQS